MNKFVFYVELKDGRLLFGHLEASGGDTARDLITITYGKDNIDSVELVGMTSAPFRAELLRGSARESSVKLKKAAESVMASTDKTTPSVGDGIADLCRLETEAHKASVENWASLWRNGLAAKESIPAHILRDIDEDKKTPK